MPDHHDNPRLPPRPATATYRRAVILARLRHLHPHLSLADRGAGQRGDNALDEVFGDLDEADIGDGRPGGKGIADQLLIGGIGYGLEVEPAPALASPISGAAAP